MNKTNQNLPLVSICIPSYNHEKYIAETISSVILQDYQNIELLIIDDASFDNSDAIINDFLSKYKSHFVRFDYHKNLTNQGISYNLNYAINWAKGKYFYAIASDDILMPFKTSLLVAEIEKLNAKNDNHNNNDNNNYAAIFGDALMINQQSQQIVVDNEMRIFLAKDIKNIELGSTKNKYYKTFLEFFANKRNFDFDNTNNTNKTNKNTNFEITYADLLQGNFLPAMSSLINLQCIKNVGAYTNGNKIEDLEIWLKLTQKYKMLLINKPVAYYRSHQFNTSKNNLPEIFKDTLKIIQQQKDFAINNGYKNEFFDVITKLITSVKKFDADFADYYANLNNVKV